MKLEHVALLVADPVAVARWYAEHLGMRVVREGDAPGNARFLADDASESVLRSTGNAPPARLRVDGPARAARRLCCRRRGRHPGAADRGRRHSGG